MSSPSNKVRNLALAEFSRAEIEARRLARRGLFIATAFLIAVFAFAMLTVSGFLALSELYGYPLGALVTGSVLVALAGIALFLSSRGPSRSTRLELELANRNVAQARADIQLELDLMDRKFNSMTFGLFSIKNDGGGLSLPTILLGAVAAFSPKLRSFILPLLPFLLRKK